jgi:hypothetical protein
MAASKSRAEKSDKDEAVEVPEVDARLDNRVGDYRPVAESFPAVPQQVDGPDLAHQAEFTRRYHEDRAKAVEEGDRKGMHSAGPHGLSDVEERKGHDRADESGGKPAPDGETGADPNQQVGDGK